MYDGYWIKTYPVPADTLEAKKKLIEALTRRLFNHTEHGLNIPGTRLSEARESYQSETDPARKKQQRVQFLKNLGIMGGLLLAAVDTEGKPGLAWRARNLRADAADKVASAREALPSR